MVRIPTFDIRQLSFHVFLVKVSDASFHLWVTIDLASSNPWHYHANDKALESQQARHQENIWVLFWQCYCYKSSLVTFSPSH